MDKLDELIKNYREKEETREERAKRLKDELYRRVVLRIMEWEEVLTGKILPVLNTYEKKLQENGFGWQLIPLDKITRRGEHKPLMEFCIDIKKERALGRLLFKLDIDDGKLAWREIGGNAETERQGYSIPLRDLDEQKTQEIINDFLERILATTS